MDYQKILIFGTLGILTIWLGCWAYRQWQLSNTPKTNVIQAWLETINKKDMIR